MEALKLTAGWIVVIFIGITGLVILWHMVNGKINLEKLISESDGTASMSRFQFLVFTLVIAMSLFLIIVGQAPLKFPDIPPEILALLGISGGSYVISKGIQKTSGGATGNATRGAGAGGAKGSGGAGGGGSSGGASGG